MVVLFRYVFAKGGLLATLFLPEIGTMYEGIWGERGKNNRLYRLLEVYANLEEPVIDTVPLTSENISCVA